MSSPTHLPTVAEWQAMDETERLRVALRYLVEQAGKHGRYFDAYPSDLGLALKVARDALGEGAVS